MHVTTAAETVSAAADDAEELAGVLSFIEEQEERHGTASDAAFFLAGTGAHDRVAPLLCG